MVELKFVKDTRVNLMSANLGSRYWRCLYQQVHLNLKFKGLPMSTETYRLTFYEQEELIQGKGVCFTLQSFTYNFYYLGYHMRMHNDYVRCLDIFIQVPFMDFEHVLCYSIQE